ncbi:MAG TPA: type I glyceraldehyde-3-phosphate dehydrogenase [Firmicutes bacterium]|nr:type I glyceraldehyde-3-phosphate dehydrogenase [Bacillota bacterium]
MVKIAINGFGRIGKNLLRILLAKGDPNLTIAAINSPSGPEKHATLFKYDSVYGIYPGKVCSTKDSLLIDAVAIPFLQEKEPENLPWKDMEVDIVIEASGRFRDREGAQKHIEAGAKKVVITAPAADPDLTVVMGVNHQEYIHPRHVIISAASCTTNCLAPVAKVLQDNLGIEHGFITTIHAYTGDQQLVDKPHKDPRRARAANLSIIPTTTGAARAIGAVLPELKGKLDGISCRVPTPSGSLVDLVVEVKKPTTIDEVNGLFAQAAQKELRGILEFTLEPLVSVDVIGNPHSAIVDGLSTMVIDKKLVKILAWYDNEYGYANRVIDLIEYLAVAKEEEKRIA